MVAQAEMIFRHTEGEKPVLAERAPISKPFKIRSGLAEEFKLHLLKLADTENKVSGSDFVTERLTYLSDTEGELFTGCTLNIYKVDEYTLCRFGAEVDCVFSIFGNSLECFEHKVELAYVCKVVLAAGGAGNIVFFNEIFHFSLCKSVDRL